MNPVAAGIFPAHRHVDLAGPPARLDPVRLGEDPSLPPQGYRLRVGSDGAVVEHRDEAGARYGRDALAQLRRAGTPVGTGVVEDWPTFTERGFMLDVSRDRVPTVATLEWLIELLGRLRFTELQLYTEHTFAFTGHEDVWADADPLTADELAHLSGRAAAAGLRIVPCGNTFGHMERFLRLDRHRHRAECPDGAPGLLGGGTTPPTTLAPTEDNARFALDLVHDLLRALPSRRVHIGGDEPFELGLGRSATAVAERGRAAVYAEHLRRLVDPLVAEGHEVLFWGDVLVRSPELVSSLPGGSVAVAWWYEPPVADPPPMSRVVGAEVAARMGVPEDALAGFAAHTRTYADTGFPFWVAPGSSSWNSLIGRWPSARANIDDAVAVGAARGARGTLLTDWGDNGHHQPLVCSLPAIVHAAGAAWCADTHDPAGVPAAVDRLVGDGADGLGDLLVELGSLDRRLGVRQFNAGALHAALLGTLAPPGRHRLDADAAAEVATVLERAASWAPAGDDRLGIVAEEVRAATGLARLGLHRLGAALDVAVPGPVPDVDGATARQAAAWRRSSRPGGLADSLARIPR